MGRAIRVMVVDDTDHVRQMLASMLTLDGFEVVDEAASGAEAVRRIEGADPDVVVIDYRMPGMDGLETARAIKEKRSSQLMVLYTAFIDDSLQQAAHEVGIEVCLGKVEGLAS